MRVLGVQLDTTEEFQIKGFGIVSTDVATVTVDTGVTYVGSTRIAKVTTKNLDTTLAADYISGTDEGTANEWVYIYMDDSGSMKLADDAPDYHDTDGTTAGTKYYFKNGTDYWRFVDIIYLDENQYIRPLFQNDDLIMWAIPRQKTITVSAGVWANIPGVSDDVPPVSNMAILGLAASQSSATCGVWVRPKDSTWSTNYQNGVLGYTGPVAGQRICMTDSSQAIQYQNDGSDATTAISVEGFYFKR
jgi:hypothetical protein